MCKKTNFYQLQTPSWIVTPPPPPPRKYKFSHSLNGFHLLVGILITLFFVSCQCESIVQPVDTPPLIVDQSFSIIENVSNGTEIGTVVATDDSDSLIYAITSGNVSNAFAISNDGLLKTAGNIDHETISNYSLTVKVTDEGGNTASNTTTIEIIDLDDTPPSITNHSFSIIENVSTSTVVGAVIATDNDRVTNYTITAGNTSNAFTISGIGLLTTAGTIDYETISNYALTVQVTDGAGNTASNTIIVNITDVAFAPNVTTLNPSGVHAVDATLHGNLTDLGEDSSGSVEVSEYGFIYSTNASNQNSLVLGASEVEKTNLGPTSNVGQFSNRVNDLSESATYYYRAYVENDIGTNFGEVRSFTTGILHASFSLSGATDGEQNGLIYPGGSHTYNVPLSHELAYNLTVDAASNILDNLAVYEDTTTNELYIQAGPFSRTGNNGGGVSTITNVTITFNGTNSGRRYLVLPLTNTNHRLVLSNGNVGAESYTLNIAKEIGSADQAVGRLLLETTMGFFTNNEPEFYWVHIPANRSRFDTLLAGFISSFSSSCGIAIDMGRAFPVSFNVYTNSITLQTNRYTILSLLHDRNTNNAGLDYRGCQYKFRLR